MSEEHTTAAVQRCLHSMEGDLPAEPIVRELLGRVANRLHILCANRLYRSYPRLAKPPANLEASELLGGVVLQLIKAMRSVHPKNPRQFFALANLHMRWQLNDLARRLDQEPAIMELHEEFVSPPDSSDSGMSPNDLRIWEAIDRLSTDDREVFELVRLQGLNLTETAKVLEISTKTVQRRLNRARLLLAEALQDLRPQSALSGESS